MSSTLVSMVKQLQNAMRADAGLDGDAQRLAQLSWMLFSRALEEKGSASLALQLPKDLTWTSLRERSKRVSPEELVLFVNSSFVPGLRSMALKAAGSSSVVARVFADVSNQISSGTILREVIARVDALFAEAHRLHHRHAVGDIYESLLSDLQSAGNAGEFYTPRALTNTIARLLRVRGGEAVMDPAAGTGGFLLSAALAAEQGGPQRPQLVGCEKKHMPFVLCATNLLLHGLLDNANLNRDNFLGGGSDALPKVDVVLTNPPFGGLEEPGIENAYAPAVRSRETADLFLLRIMEALRDGGRAAVVLPDRFLFASGPTARIRSLLCQTFNLHTVVRLPEGVFAPYTGIKTNILFFDRTTPTNDTWFYEVRVPDGKRTFSKSQPLSETDLQALEEWWTDRAEGSFARCVSIAELERQGFNLDIRLRRQRNLRPQTRASLDSFREHAKIHRNLRESLLEELESLLSDSPSFLARGLLGGASVLSSSSAGIVTMRKAIARLGCIGSFSLPGESAGASDYASESDSLFPSSDTVWKGWFEETFAASIPAGWRWQALHQAGEIVSGGTPSTHDASNFAERGIPWLTPADLNGLRSKGIATGRRDLSERGLNSCSARVLPVGSVLFSSRAPIGYVAIASAPLATNQGFKSVIPNSSVSPDYLYYYLLAWADLIETHASGTTFKEVSGKLMARVPCLLPPIGEQARIVAALDSLFGKLDALEIAFSQLAGAQSEYARLLADPELATVGRAPMQASKD